MSKFVAASETPHLSAGAVGDEESRFRLRKDVILDEKLKLILGEINLIFVLNQISELKLNCHLL